MRILYGVQGTGNGHISRCRLMAKALKNEDYEIVCIANNDELSYSSYQILEDLNIKFIVAENVLNIPDFFKSYDYL